MNPILESIKPVIANSKHVKINILKIEEVAKKLSNFQFPEQKYDFFPKLDRNGINQFALVLNSINFQFRDWRTPNVRFEINYKNQIYKGFFGLAYSLRKNIENDLPILDAGYLSNLSEQEALKFLKTNIIIPFFKKRVKILNEVGKVLKQKYDGQFSNFLKTSNKAFDNGNGLVEKIVINFPSFNDIRIYKPTNSIVKFYKKAQLMLAILHHNPYSDFRLEDIGELTVFSDYKLPQALRDLGILEYTSELANKIDNFVMIQEGSDEEVEMRAHTIHASDLLCKEVNKHREDKITPSHVDEYLWLEGKKSKKPRHFTETIFY
ncbi:MAG: hypothetical protein GTN40_02765 [Candidatus Aenigmarchaeota archaeon]|nr:hypothetical protein [Candidatus Aenigmarchaeota archaeon]